MKKNKLQTNHANNNVKILKNEEIVLHLIREELKNKYLMFSLENLGFDCSFYVLNVSQVVLNLACPGIVTEGLHRWYNRKVEKSTEKMTFRNLEPMLDKWATRIKDEIKRKIRCSTRKG